MSYDFSHLSPQDTKTAMRLVHRIDELTRDIDICTSESTKHILHQHLLFTKHLLNSYVDPLKYNYIKEILTYVFN